MCLTTESHHPPCHCKTCLYMQIPDVTPCPNRKNEAQRVGRNMLRAIHRNVELHMRLAAPLSSHGAHKKLLGDTVHELPVLRELTKSYRGTQEPKRERHSHKHQPMTVPLARFVQPECVRHFNASPWKCIWTREVVMC